MAQALLAELVPLPRKHLQLAIAFCFDLRIKSTSTWQTLHQSEVDSDQKGVKTGINRNRSLPLSLPFRLSPSLPKFCSTKSLVSPPRWSPCAARASQTCNASATTSSGSSATEIWVITINLDRQGQADEQRMFKRVFILVFLAAKWFLQVVQENL